MSAMAELRDATGHSHQRLERRLDVKRRFSDLAAYREHLQHMYGFCAGLERRLAQPALSAALTDYAERRKLPLLRRDLVALGIGSAVLAGLPSCETLPECAETAEALGCLYVLEGATLGGQTLLPMVRARLGLTADTGAAFLASYGDEVSTMWQRFGGAVDAWCATPERSARAAQAAVASFEALEAWLCGARA
jgi:heme oxygenase